MAAPGQQSESLTDRETARELFRRVHLIRAVEEKIRKVYPEDEMKTPVHLSVGAEAIEAGVCRALQAPDQVYGTYRTHGLYLATGGNLTRFFAELLGHSTGVFGGRAGSMHLASPATGFMMSSAIVASILPVALGAAFAASRLQTGAVAVVFFGDGATEEGVFWETLNMAALHSLPLLFVCEDNGLAIHVPREIRQAYSIPEAARLFGIETVSAAGIDVMQVHELASRLLSDLRRRCRPGFLHLTYHRHLEHVGINEDYGADYRRPDEQAEWPANDPVDIARQRCLETGLGEDELRRIVERTGEEIEAALSAAGTGGPGSPDEAEGLTS